MELNAEECPLCGTELSGLKFREIQAKLHREEQEKVAELARVESAVRLQFEQQFNHRLQKERLTLEKKAKDAADAQIKGIASERDLAAKKLKEADARAIEIQRQAQQDIAKEKLAAQCRSSNRWSSKSRRRLRSAMSWQRSW
jgi:DNA repair exonuclease SbcCD ATPase subunit